jgi:nifR3 family TIM-barrel protein
MATIWDSLNKPVFVLAPMANVTDAAFRRIIAKYGKPDIFWTEFVSVEGLLSAGREKLLIDFWYDPNQHPIVAQIFGSKPDQFYEVAKLIVSLGFDGIDINMGCPDKGVEKSGGGAALIKNPKLAQEVIRATQRGVADAGSNIPVSVKTRIGYNKVELDTWLPALLETNPAAITLHLRTRKEMSLVPAHWELMPHAVALRDKSTPKTLILGNGDVQDLAQARERVKETGCDGVMLGRAIFGNPWLFGGLAKKPRSERSSASELPSIPSVEEKLRVCIEHTKLFEELFGEGTAKNGGRIKNFDVMKKHYKAYVNGFDGAKELRAKMMEAQNPDEVSALVMNFFK